MFRINHKFHFRPYQYARFLRNIKILKSYGYCTHVTSTNEPKIIIIGAGIAGLSAADHLISHGFSNFKILEASNRIGGRICTKKLNNSFCELGAKFAPESFLKYKEDEIAILKLKDKQPTLKFNLYVNGIENEQLVNNTGNRISSKRKSVYISSNGEFIDNKLVENAYIAFNGIINESEFRNKVDANYFNSNNSKLYLETETEKIVKNVFPKKSHIASQVMYSFIRDLSSKFGSDLSNIYISQISKTFKYYKNALPIETGLISLIQSIEENFTPNQIIKEKPVRNIRWSNIDIDKPDALTVLTMDSEIFRAEHVICAVPLSVIKIFSPLLFTPLLPIHKISAMEEFGIGTPGTIFLVYSDNISKWLTYKSIKPIWSFKEIHNSSIFFKDIAEISRVPGSNSILEIKRSGIEEFEKIPDAEIVHQLTKIFRLLTKNEKVPYPKDILRSTWSADSKYLGGIPYIKQKYGRILIEILKKPISNKFENPALILAGDYCDWNGLGTIQGARNSGIYAADQIVKFYEK